MRKSLVGGALIGVLTAGASLAHAPEATDFRSGPAREAAREGEGGLGASSSRLASALGAASSFLSDDRQSLLLPVGEGGEGGEGGRGRYRRFHPAPSYGPYRGDLYYRGSRFYGADPYRRGPCRIVARRVWDPLYGWVTRRERVCY